MQTQTNSKHTKISQSDKSHPKGKIRKFEPYYHQKHKHDHLLQCPQQMECCSKHQNCIHQVTNPYSQIKSGLPNSNQTGKQESDFSISSDLLKEQQPQFIDIHPAVEPNTQHPQVEWIVNENLKRKKQQFLQKKITEQSEKQKRKDALKQLARNTREALGKSKKKPFDKPVTSWNHAIFETGLNKTQEEGQPQKQQQIHKKRAQKHRQIQLKPIKQRIKQFKKTQQLKQQKQKHTNHEMNCCHKDHTEQQISKINSKINQNSKSILEKNKSQKQAALNQKKLKHAKILALHIKSLESLKHFKKKPVPKDGDFIFDIPLNNDKNNKKQAKSKRSQEQEKAKAAAQQAQKALESTKKIRKTGNYPKKQVQAQQTKNLAQQQKQKLYNKFYFWNVPIMNQDFSAIVGHQDTENSSKWINQTTNSLTEKSKVKTFKQQVEEYLSQKFKRRMENQKQKTKQQIFQEAVQKKKKQLLEQNKNPDRANVMEQRFWNQDEEFRLHQLQNFHFFPKKGSIQNVPS